MKYNKFTRRMFLQGSSGFLLQMPFLVSLLPRELWAQTSVQPSRFYISFLNRFGYGHMKYWFPTINVLDSKFSPGNNQPVTTYQSLESFKTSNGISHIWGSEFNNYLSYMNLFRGADYLSETPDHGISHLLGNISDCHWIDSSKVPHIPTIDLVMAKNRTFNPLGKSPVYLTCGGRSGDRSKTYSHNGSSKVVADASNPLEAYQKFLSGKTEGSSGTNISHPRLDSLSRVIEDYNRIKNSNKISSADKITASNYLDLLSDLNRNIASTPTTTNLSCQHKNLSTDNDGYKYTSSPQTYENYAKIIVAMAMCNVSPIIQMATFPHDIEGGSGESFHSGLSHNQDEITNGVPNTKHIADIQKTLYKYFLPHLLGGLNSVIDQANGKSLLHNSLVHIAMEHSYNHYCGSLPVAFFGNAGGTISSGNFIDYSTPNRDKFIKNSNATDPNDRRFRGWTGIPYNRLLVRIMKSFGIQPSEYEDSKYMKVMQNRSDGHYGSHNNGISHVGGFGWTGNVAPYTPDSSEDLVRIFSAYNFHHYKYPAPLPGSNNS